jgi:hypothetical protein
MLLIKDENSFVEYAFFQPEIRNSESDKTLHLCSILTGSCAGLFMEETNGRIEEEVMKFPYFFLNSSTFI